MITTKRMPTLPQSRLHTLGWDWLVGEDTLPYVTDEMVLVTQKEAENYYNATNELYEMFVKAGQYAIDKNLLDKLGIPASLHKLVKYTWENDTNHWHLYGRFDLAGGLDNQPIKLIEFNANTATCIPETAIIQSAQLLANGYAEAQQFNSLYEALVENFIRLREQNPQLHAAILFSGMKGYPEDTSNLEVLAEAAKEAHFYVKIETIDAIEFSEEDGIFWYDKQKNQYENFGFWFSLVPWEFIGNDEPELAQTLTKLIASNKAVVLNPAYTLLFQSKYILKILWDLFPYHPLLLETTEQPMGYKKQVEKVLFGREGANVRVLSATGQTENWRDGEYENQPKVYQEYVTFLKDYQNNSYQAGVFFAYEACGLGFRRGGEILDNQAQFCGHLIE
jgi:glutathionylspermidine synthase